MINTEIHKETATTVGTGLIINYPLNVFLLFLFIDVFAWSNTFLIGTVVTGIITLVAYTRVYIIRNYFNNRGWARVWDRRTTITKKNTFITVLFVCLFSIPPVLGVDYDVKIIQIWYLKEHFIMKVIQ